MAKEVQRTGSMPWRLIYAGRAESSMAFLNEVEDLGHGTRTLFEDGAGRPDVDGLVDDLRADDLLYVCGPTGLIEATRKAAEQRGRARQVRYELFAAPDGDGEAMGPPFEVEPRRSGVTVKIPPDFTVLREVRASGAHVLSDCEDGICGSCETPILDGAAEHRDHVLLPEEQQANTCMMICVSRSAGGRLVLDL